MKVALADARDLKARPGLTMSFRIIDRYFEKSWLFKGQTLIVHGVMFFEKEKDTPIDGAFISSLPESFTRQETLKNVEDWSQVYGKMKLPSA